MTWNRPRRLRSPDHNLGTTARRQGGLTTPLPSRGNISVRQRTDDTSCSVFPPRYFPAVVSSYSSFAGRVEQEEKEEEAKERERGGVRLLPFAIRATSVLRSVRASLSLPLSPVSSHSFFSVFFFYFPIPMYNLRVSGRDDCQSERTSASHRCVACQLICSYETRTPGN